MKERWPQVVDQYPFRLSLHLLQKSTKKWDNTPLGNWLFIQPGALPAFWTVPLASAFFVFDSFEPMSKQKNRLNINLSPDPTMAAAGEVALTHEPIAVSQKKIARSRTVKYR